MGRKIRCRTETRGRKTTSYSPDYERYLGEPCAKLYLEIGLLLHNVCGEIDARYDELPTRKRKKYTSSRALIRHKLTKIHGYIKQTKKAGEVIVEAMAEKVTDDGLVIKEVIK